MRITHGMLNDRLLADLRDRQVELARTQREVSTQRRIQRPSDDPLAARDAVLQRTTLEGLDAHRRGVGSAVSRLDASDTALGAVGDVLLRARELAIQGANGTLAQKDRDKIALEIDQLAEAAKEALRVTVDGAELFSGTATTTAPYAAGSDVYAGDNGVVAREVGPGVSVQVNVTAGAILGSGTTAADGKVLDTLRGLATHLRGGTATDLAALRGTDLQALQANADAVGTARATLGATRNRVDAAETRLDQLEDAGRLRLSELEDTDLAEALTHLSSQQTAYEAALRSGASLVQTSLLDFLR